LTVEDDIPALTGIDNGDGFIHGIRIKQGFREGQDDNPVLGVKGGVHGAGTPDVIAEQIIDVSKWTDFKGYLFLPGIKVASFEIKTATIGGSRIRVINTDGSTHVKEIVDWQPG